MIIKSTELEVGGVCGAESEEKIKSLVGKHEGKTELGKHIIYGSTIVKWTSKR
jgi:hypothetical protein